MVPNAVMMTTGTSGSRARISESSSRPLIPGIMWSVTTTSTAEAERRSSASTPSPATITS